jgi:hypothetical protein
LASVTGVVRMPLRVPYAVVPYRSASMVGRTRLATPKPSPNATIASTAPRRLPPTADNTTDAAA